MKRAKDKRNSWALQVLELRATGMSLKDVGDAIGLSVSATGDIAASRTAAPKGESALKLAALHGLVVGRKSGTRRKYGT
jgi:hypothetical protein